MTDKYTQFVSQGPGRDIARKLGLPQPVVLRRHQPGQPLVTGPVLVQGGGSGADALAVDAPVLEPRCAPPCGAQGEARRHHPRTG